MSTTTKKTKRDAAPPTPEMQAQLDAEFILSARSQIEALEREISVSETRLKAWAAENGKTELFGLFTVVSRMNQVKLVGATGKLLEIHVEKLLAELDPAYIQNKATLDLKRMQAAIESDAALAALLKVKGLSLVQENSVSLRKV